MASEKSKCQKDIEGLGGRLEICREVQSHHYEMRQFDEAKDWAKICMRIEEKLKSMMVKCERG